MIILVQMRTSNTRSKAFTRRSLRSIVRVNSINLLSQMIALLSIIGGENFNWKSHSPTNFYLPIRMSLIFFLIESQWSSNQTF